MNKIYLICGVPGSGKTWVLSQFTNSGTKVIHHDNEWLRKLKTMHYDNHFDTPRQEYAMRLVQAAKDSIVIADCPLGVSEIIQAVKAQGCPITPLFIVEDPKVVEQRYVKREGKPIPKQHLGRIKTMVLRAKEYNAFSGTSKEVYQYLLTHLLL